MKYLIEDSQSDKFYMRDNFTQQDISYIVGQNIYEYDMKDAGYSLIKEFDQLPHETIRKLSEMSKEKRRVAIGKIMKADREFSVKHTKSFGLIRQRFILENNIEKSDVLSIRKDAIFIIGKKCNELKFGEVSFSEKNKYTSYHRYGQIEFLYRSSNNTLHVKGIDDKKFSEHDEFMGKFLRTVYKHLEAKNTERLVQFLLKFNHMYKSRTLPSGYYRELNATSKFLINPRLSKYSVYLMNHVEDAYLSEIDITHNYVNIVLPIMQRHYFSTI